MKNKTIVYNICRSDKRNFLSEILEKEELRNPYIKYSIDKRIPDLDVDYVNYLLCIPIFRDEYKNKYFCINNNVNNPINIDEFTKKASEFMLNNEYDINKDYISFYLTNLSVSLASEFMLHINELLDNLLDVFISEDVSDEDKLIAMYYLKFLILPSNTKISDLPSFRLQDNKENNFKFFSKIFYTYLTGISWTLDFYKKNSNNSNSMYDLFIKIFGDNALTSPIYPYLMDDLYKVGRDFMKYIRAKSFFDSMERFKYVLNINNEELNKVLSKMDKEKFVKTLGLIIGFNYDIVANEWTGIPYIVSDLLGDTYKEIPDNFGKYIEISKKFSKDLINKYPELDEKVFLYLLYPEKNDKYYFYLKKYEVIFRDYFRYNKGKMKAVAVDIKISNHQRRFYRNKDTFVPTISWLIYLLDYTLYSLPKESVYAKDLIDRVIEGSKKFLSGPTYSIEIHEVLFTWYIKDKSAIDTIINKFGKQRKINNYEREIVEKEL